MGKKIRSVLCYGSETGNTRNRSFDIQRHLINTPLELEVSPLDLADVPVKKILEYDYIIFGTPTWNIGELQADIEAIVEEIEELDFTGKQIAMFGCGDQEGYPDTYQDALGILGERLELCGAKLGGFTSTIGHYFTESRGLREGKFLGLALDDDNQSDESLTRIKDWVKQLLNELKVIKEVKKNE